MLPREFCALLIAGDFVELHKQNSGIVEVKLKNDQWKEFVKRYIQKDNKIGESLCEFTDTNTIYIDALKDGAKKVKRKKNAPYRQMALLRVGAYAVAGERVKPTLQINDCDEPPRFDHRTRTAHRLLTNSIRSVIDDIYLGDDIEHVMEWLEMKDVMEGTKDDNNKKTAPPPPPPPPQPKPTSTTSKADPTPTKPTASTTIGNEITPPATTIKTKALPPPPTNLKDGSDQCNKLSQQLGGTYELPDGKQVVISERTKNLFDQYIQLQQQLDQLGNELEAQIQQDNPTTLSAPPALKSTNTAATSTANFTPSHQLPNITHTLTGHPDNYIDEVRRKRFRLLAPIGVAILTEPTPDEKDDIGKVNRERLLREITDLMRLNNEPIAYTTSNYRYRHSYIKVTTRAKDPEYLNLQDGMKELFGIGQRGQVMEHLMDYLYKYRKDELMEALRVKKVLPKKMSSYETAVMMNEANILPTNLRKLTQCMTTFMDLDKRLWADENEIRELGKHRVIPVIDVYNHPTSDDPNCVKEKIRFWYKNPAEMHSRSVQCLADGIPNFDPVKIDFIHSCHGADHATKDRGKSRMVAKTVMKYDGEYHIDIYSIADVECRKDTATIMKNTIMPAVVEGMNAITTGKLIFHEDEQSSK